MRPDEQAPAPSSADAHTQARGTRRNNRAVIADSIASYWPFWVGGLLLAALAGLLIVNARGGGETQVERRIERVHALSDAAFARELGVLLGPPFLDGNRVTTLLNGDQIFPAMLAAIRSASVSITFETYIYWSGDIGRAFADALAERARHGVKVHVLLDWVGSAKMDEQLIEAMKDAGVEVHKFHPPHWSKLGRLNNRTHRKLLVVDGRLAFTGGVGIAPTMDRACPGPRRTGATRTTRSKGRWWRRCSPCSWTTGSR